MNIDPIRISFEKDPYVTIKKLLKATNLPIDQQRALLVAARQPHNFHLSESRRRTYRVELKPMTQYLTFRKSDPSEQFFSFEKIGDDPLLHKGMKSFTPFDLIAVVPHIYEMPSVRNKRYLLSKSVVIDSVPRYLFYDNEKHGFALGAYDDVYRHAEDILVALDVIGAHN